MTIDVIGEEAIIKKLTALEKKLQRKILSKALRAAAKIQLAEAKLRVPVDTGSLKSSLKVRVLKKGKRRGGKVLRMGVLTGTRAQLGIKGDSYYPAYLEYGSSRATAQPFMRPAFEASKAKAKDAAAMIIKQGLGL